MKFVDNSKDVDVLKARLNRFKLNWSGSAEQRIRLEQKIKELSK